MADSNAEQGTPPSQPTEAPQVDRSAQTPRVTVEMPAEQAYFLQRTQVLHEVQGELLAWGKRRFWVISFVVVAVGALGGYAFIKETVRSFVEREVGKVERETREASKAAVLAQDSAAKARAATEEAAKQAETYGRTVGALQERAKEVDALFLGVRQRVDAESGSLKVRAEKDVKEISDRLNRLDELVASLAKESQASRQALDAYRKELAEMKASAQAERGRFAANAEYRVTVYFNDKTKNLSDRVVERLRQAGFKTSAQAMKEVAEILPKLPSIAGPRVTAVNSITYTPDAKMKAEEVRDLVAPLVLAGRLKLVEKLLLAGDQPWMFLQPEVPSKFALVEKQISVLLSVE